MKTLNLRVVVHEIPEPGLPIEGELDQEWVAESLMPAYTADSSLSVRLLVKRIGDNVHVDGELAITLAFVCSRTLAPGTLALRVPMGELFTPEHAHKMKLGSGVDGDELEGDEPYTYEGDTIDLEPYVREQLVLAQDPYPKLDDSEPAEGPAWSNDTEPTDPRWAKLRNIKLS